MRCLVITGSGHGTGKTLFTVGLLAALRKRGVAVQPFKVGPDFEDAALHQVASGRRSVHLDGWLQGSSQSVKDVFHSYANGCDLAVVDGFCGLFDGCDGLSEHGSTASVAKLLGASLLYIADGSNSMRSIAALLKGSLSYDADVKLSGVVANKAGAQVQAAALQQAMSECNLQVPVLGCLPKLDALDISNTLRLSSKEQEQVCLYLAEIVERHVDIQLLLDSASSLEPQPSTSTTAGSLQHASLRKVRIGVAYDAAFCSYFTANLELLEQCGAELVKFSPLHDAQLPDGLCGLYLGGCLMQYWAEQLSSNKSMLVAIQAFSEAGGVVFAEGASLMYLSRSVEDGSTFDTHAMAGVFSFRTRLLSSPSEPHAHCCHASSNSDSHSYVQVHIQPGCALFPPAEVAKGICFSSFAIIEERVVGSLSPSKSTQTLAAAAAAASSYTHAFSVQVLRGQELVPEGYSRRNVVASCVQMYLPAQPSLARHLVDKARRVNTIAVDAAVSTALSPVGLQRASSASSGLPPNAAHMRNSRSVNDLLSRSTTVSNLINGRGSFANERHSLSADSTPPSQGHEAGWDPKGMHSRTDSLSLLHEHAGAPGANGVPVLVEDVDMPADAKPEPSRLRRTHLEGASRDKALLQDQNGWRSASAGAAIVSPPPDDAAHTSGRHYLSFEDAKAWTSVNGGGPVVMNGHAGGGMQHTGSAQGSCEALDKLSSAMEHPTVAAASSSASKSLAAAAGLLASGAASHPYSYASTSPPLGSMMPSCMMSSHSSPTHIGPPAKNAAAAGQFAALYSLRNDAIVSLCPASTEALVAMGLGNRLTGISDVCDYPADLKRSKAVVCTFRPPGSVSPHARGSMASEMAKLGEEADASGAAAALPPTAFGGSTGSMTALSSLTNVAGAGAAGSCSVAAQLDVGFLAKEAPALVILPAATLTQELSAQQAYCFSALEEAGLLSADSCTAVLQPRSHSLCDVLDFLLQLGQAACAPHPARLLVDRLRARLRAVVATASSAHARPRVLVLSSLQPFTQAGKWVHDMVSLLGTSDMPGLPGSSSFLAAVAAAAATTTATTSSGRASGSQQLSWDQIRQSAPDVLILLNDHERSLLPLTHVAGLPGWWSVPAVKNGQVFVVDSVYCTRPGPRLVDGVETLARILYPDLVSKRAPQGSVLKLSLQGGQRCRQKLLPNYFMPWT